jgi:NDP-sugar pyrophosphorylase family protein
VLGAILVIGLDSSNANGLASAGQKLFLSSKTPRTCMKILGRSVVERMTEIFHQIGVETISMVADRAFTDAQSDIDHAANKSPVSWVNDTWGGVIEGLKSYRNAGIKTAFVMCMDAYAELDPFDALHFHWGQERAVTRISDGDGPLNIWIVDLVRFDYDSNVFTDAASDAAQSYVVGGYVNRLQTAKDLRRLVTDSLSGHCQFRPAGSEIRPGVWLGESVEIHRGARIVAPAYIGRGSKVNDNCLITRCSNIENDCEIDFGTVVEDSSILSNSYVGIGLDISHSIVAGKNLLNLTHDRALEITDPAVIRENIVTRGETHRSSPIQFGLEGMLFEPAE